VSLSRDMYSFPPVFASLDMLNLTSSLEYIQLEKVIRGWFS